MVGELGGGGFVSRERRGAKSGRSCFAGTEYVRGFEKQYYSAMSSMLALDDPQEIQCSTTRWS